MHFTDMQGDITIGIDWHQLRLIYVTGCHSILKRLHVVLSNTSHSLLSEPFVLSSEKYPVNGPS